MGELEDQYNRDKKFYSDGNTYNTILNEQKTKVIPSSLSNPKHKLRKCNVKSMRKNKCCEKILIEKLKELTLSSKNESAQKRTQ